jgi:hypothetical protein
MGYFWNSFRKMYHHSEGKLVTGFNATKAKYSCAAISTDLVSAASVIRGLLQPPQKFEN